MNKALCVCDLQPRRCLGLTAAAVRSWTVVAWQTLLPVHCDSTDDSSHDSITRTHQQLPYPTLHPLITVIELISEEDMNTYKLSETHTDCNISAMYRQKTLYYMCKPINSALNR